MSEIYINGVGCISPQITWDTSTFLPEIRSNDDNFMYVIEPDYSPFFDAGFMRRMGRLAKFATTAAVISLRDAGIAVPDAITTATGFGLLENSGKFLKSVIEQKEAVVSPTNFIQSTHNTIGGAKALMTGCHGPNNTFSQRGSSFESSLIESIMLMKEGIYANILTGAFDELTDYSLAIMERLHLLRSKEDKTKQTAIIAGEGAAFFVLSKNKEQNSYCRLIDTEVLFNSATIDISSSLLSFLQRNGLEPHEIDIVLSGMTGDEGRDESLTSVNESLFFGKTIIAYKELCGEYMTSSSFAVWLAAKIIRTGLVPPPLGKVGNMSISTKNILIHNSYKGTHTFILLGAC